MKIMMMAGMVASLGAAAQTGPRLGPMEERFGQEQFEQGVNLVEVRAAGLTMFATQFNRLDGYGDGPVRPEDPTSPGGRPTLGGNGTFLRVNGLDGQSCVDCHAMVSSATTPPTFGVGGFGGLNDAPIFQPKVMDVSDISGLGLAFTDGRLIVPPHLFGAGGVQLLAEEMTVDLTAQRDQALAQPGTPVALHSKGVNFGHLTADADGTLDTSAVEGVDADLIVRPFGRKGEFPTVRAFDEGAMQFHFGMQPVESFGLNTDDDGDGVMNEVLVGEMSALEVFITTQDRPRQERMGAEALGGFLLFHEVGCSDCHRTSLETTGRRLSYRTTDDAEAHFSVDLGANLPSFFPNGAGGLVIPLFSDLKRHDMGDGLAESFQGADAKVNREFITARLWGVADSAPYLHDGRALSLEEAIGWHAGEAEEVRAAYDALSQDAKNALLAFLNTLRLPQQPNQDVLSQR